MEDSDSADDVIPDPTSPYSDSSDDELDVSENCFSKSIIRPA